MKSSYRGVHLVITTKSAETPKLLMVVPRALVKTAVERNKIKRWVRVAWRESSLGTGGITSVRFNKGLNKASFSEIQSDFAKATLELKG